MVNDIITKLINLGISKEEEIHGCSDEEIFNIETSLNKKLPKEYKNFLYQVGHSAGEFFKGTDIFYNNIFSLKEWSINLLEEDRSQFKLKENDFVFSMHQGYQFAFFNLMDGDNPSIYYYLEGSNNNLPLKIYNHFSEYIEISIEDYRKVLEESKK